MEPFENQPDSQESSPNSYRMQKKADGFSTASLCFGLIALLLCLTGIFPMFFGAFSILFAILSTRKAYRMANSAKNGIIFSIIGIVVGGYVTYSAVHTLFTDPMMYAQYNALYKQMYGESLDDVFGSTFGFNIVPPSSSSDSSLVPSTPDSKSSEGNNGSYGYSGDDYRGFDFDQLPFFYGYGDGFGDEFGDGGNYEVPSEAGNGALNL